MVCMEGCVSIYMCVCVFVCREGERKNKEKRKYVLRDLHTHIHTHSYTHIHSLTHTGMQGVPAKASRGNFLEAINVTLNVLEKHYMDRDLTRTGNSIVMISPSSGVVEVDSKLSGRGVCVCVCV